MTRDEAAAALEQLVEARGPDWVSHTWGIARDRLAGWLEGSEDLPEWMVVVMRAHVEVTERVVREFPGLPVEGEA